MVNKSEIKVESVSYYLVISRQSSFGEKVHAEYDTRNNNLRIYVYGGDVIREAYYDDDNDGKVETYFLNGESVKRNNFSQRKASFLDALLAKYSGRNRFRNPLNKDFAEVDAHFKEYKRLLNVSGVLAGKKIVSSAQVLDDLFK